MKKLNDDPIFEIIWPYEQKDIVNNNNKKKLKRSFKDGIK